MKPDICAGCGRQRGDGRRDRGWKYIYANPSSVIDSSTKLVVLACYCASCKATAPKGQP